MNFIALLLRIYSFVFHMMLGVFLVTSAAISYRSHRTMNLDMLPFPDENLLRDTVLLGLIGIFCTLLSLTRTLKILFVLWTALAFYLMLKWFFLESYVFDDAHQTRGAIWLTFGALGAFFGAAWAMRTRRHLSML